MAGTPEGPLVLVRHLEVVKYLQQRLSAPTVSSHFNSFDCFVLISQVNTVVPLFVCKVPARIFCRFHSKDSSVYIEEFSRKKIYKGVYNH